MARLKRIVRRPKHCFTLALTWAKTFYLLNSIKSPRFKADNFYIHGLWSNEEQTEPVNEPFEAAELLPIYHQLFWSWPNLKNADHPIRNWEEGWKGHGILQRRLKLRQYFSGAAQLTQRFDIGEALEAIALDCQSRLHKSGKLKGLPAWLLHHKLEKRLKVPIVLQCRSGKTAGTKWKRALLYQTMLLLDESLRPLNYYPSSVLWNDNFHRDTIIY